jgi:hypothetical protein
MTAQGALPWVSQDLQMGFTVTEGARGQMLEGAPLSHGQGPCFNPFQGSQGFSAGQDGPGRLRREGFPQKGVRGAPPGLTEGTMKASSFQSS